MPKVGAHVSASVSLDLSLDRAKAIGADCCQIFVSPPQQWVKTSHPEEEIALFVTKQQEFSISPNFIHGTYLVNLGTDDPAHLEKSIDWLTYGMTMASKLQVKGVIFHTGSHKGRGFDNVVGQITEAINKVLSNSPEKPLLLLENCAGAGGVVGSFEELGQILQQVNDPRLKVCLDTQHAFGNGYDFQTDNGLENLISTIDHHIGWDNLQAIHCNDSKVELASNRDRHENIGEGFIGKDAFSLMLNHPKFTDLPFLLEVPGFAGNGPDRENVDILKSLLKKA